MEQNKRTVQRCAIYTRKSSEEGLEQEFNSLHAQREACEAFIKSQAGEGWRLVKTAYDDGGLSGATMERPALKRLMIDLNQGLIDVVVVYKVDRLTRSLGDFAKMVEAFDTHSVSFVSVTQQFNTTTSMGRLTLNVLLSFAQFERESRGSWLMLALVIEGLVMLGERSRAGELYPLVDELLDTGAVALWPIFRLTHTIAGIGATAVRQWEAAEAHFEIAHQQAKAFPQGLEQAEIRRFHAMMLMDRAASGDSDKAQTLLIEALVSYTQIGMPRHIEMTRTLLSRIA